MALDDTLIALDDTCLIWCAQLAAETRKREAIKNGTYDKYAHLQFEMKPMKYVGTPSPTPSLPLLL